MTDYKTQSPAGHGRDEEMQWARIMSSGKAVPGVVVIFLLTMLVIAVLGQVLRHRYPRGGPGQTRDGALSISAARSRSSALPLWPGAGW